MKNNNSTLSSVRKGVDCWTFDGNAFEDFLVNLQGLKKETAEQYNRAVWNYLQWSKKENFESVENYRAYIKTLAAGYFSKSTINCLNTAIRRWNTWRNGTHFELDKGIRKPRKFVQIVPDVVVQKVAEQAINSNEDICVKTAIMLLCFSGMRASEIVGNNFDYPFYCEKHALKIVGKNGKERIVPFCSQLSNWYKMICQDDKTREKVEHSVQFWEWKASSQMYKEPTQVLRMILQRLCANAMVDYYKPHAFRHTFATKLVTNGIPLIKIANIMGHSSIRVTQMYVHLQPEDIADIELVRGEL